MDILQIRPGSLNAEKQARILAEGLGSLMKNEKWETKYYNVDLKILVGKSLDFQPTLVWTLIIDGDELLEQNKPSVDDMLIKVIPSVTTTPSTTTTTPSTTTTTPSSTPKTSSSTSNSLASMSIEICELESVEKIKEDFLIMNLQRKEPLSEQLDKPISGLRLILDTLDSTSWKHPNLYQPKSSPNHIDNFPGFDFHSSDSNRSELARDLEILEKILGRYD